MTTNSIRQDGPARQTRRPFYGVPAAVILAFLLVGCYTILKHPITSEEGRVQSHHQEYYRDRCLECHADYAEYPYGFFYGTYPDYYFEYPRWGYYYAYPWWWDNYWYEGGSSDEVQYDDAGQPVTPSAKASRRGGLIPPYVGGASAVPPPSGGYQRSVPPPVKQGTGSGTTGAGTAPGTKVRVKKADDSSSDDNATDQTNSKKKKAGRRGGIEP
jgi:hypothetical protein